MNAPAEELQETQELVRTLYAFVEQYRQHAPRTDERALRNAAKRVEESLIDCLRRAVDELTAGNLGDRMRAVDAALASLENLKGKSPSPVFSARDPVERFLLSSRL
jgi:hypothetical protein